MMSGQQICRALFSVAVLWLLASTNTANAQSVVLDQTFGNGPSLGAGPTYRVTEAAGRTIGNNLFHSFLRFSLLGGETAEFTTTSAIGNILARVTGGEVSTIDGTIRSPANLFFLNPNGVVFNLRATLDISGSFHVSTADYLRMGTTAFFVDESRASANLPSVIAIDPGVFIDPPEAFGFVSENPASITVNGSTLRVAEGARIALVGGETTLTGGGLTARSGSIHIASVLSTGEAILTQEGLDTGSFSELGELEMRAGAKLDASESLLAPDGAGQIVIRAGRFELDSARLFGRYRDREWRRDRHRRLGSFLARQRFSCAESDRRGWRCRVHNGQGRKHRDPGWKSNRIVDRGSRQGERHHHRCFRLDRGFKPRC